MISPFAVNLTTAKSRVNYWKHLQLYNRKAKEKQSVIVRFTDCFLAETQGLVCIEKQSVFFTVRVHLPLGYDEKIIRGLSGFRTILTNKSMYN